ncbi:MAG: thiamine pyrophosphate-binding protein [Rhodospirillaceae bacterium]|nr:thiamine pyrophosphate-binding protein [Rhodospirillaceae bacterium]|tara:strand:- start:30957 stop:31526 length:570 start_codon:yes stop_codon:yes gene_type:complete
MMKRDDCLKSLAGKIAQDEIVVAAYTTAFEWIAIRPSPCNYISSGAMGMTSSHALGFALAWPDRRIILLDGDGSLLMNLGCLVTTANAAPKNLIHFVLENGTYEANGGHPIPGQNSASFAGMAESAGYNNCHELSDLESFEDNIGSILQEEGPTFVTLKCVPGEDYPQDYRHMHSAKLREDFAEAVKNF